LGQLKNASDESYELRPWRDLLTWEAKTIALALVLISINSRTARRWCCRAFLALFGANRLSLSTNASLNFSATDNSVELEEDAEMGFKANPCTVHVLGSISLTTSSSNMMFCNASLGTSVPMKPKGDDLGFTTTRGHSVEKSSKEILSMFGCISNKINHFSKKSQPGKIIATLIFPYANENQSSLIHQEMQDFLDFRKDKNPHSATKVWRTYPYEPPEWLCTTSNFFRIQLLPRILLHIIIKPRFEYTQASSCCVVTPWTPSAILIMIHPLLWVL